LSALADRLKKEVGHLVKDAAIDRLLGEVESFEIREKAHLERIEKVKKTSHKSAAPVGQVSGRDIKTVAKNAALVTMGAVTAALDSGAISWPAISVAVGLGFINFLQRLLTNGGQA